MSAASVFILGRLLATNNCTNVYVTSDFGGPLKPPFPFDSMQRHLQSLTPIWRMGNVFE